MEKEILNKLRKNWKTVILITFLTVVLGLVLSLLQPLKYRASVELLIIQKQEQAIDPYVASRAAERLSKNLSQVIYTTSFFDKVMNAGFAIENNFSSLESKKRKEWKKMIDTQVVLETGMLKISVYHKDKNQAAQIAQAIAYVLTTQGDEYHGAGKNVAIKTVDAVLTSRYPVKPNLPVNLVSSLVLGVLAGSGFIILRSKEKLNKEEINKIESLGHAENKPLVIQAEKVILEAPKEFFSPSLKEEVEEKSNQEIKEGQKLNFSQVKQSIPKVKPKDGIWTMYDYLESENSPSYQYLYNGEKLELKSEV